MSELMHEGRSKLDGAPIGSGRYPLGSGEEPYQRDTPFNAIVTAKVNAGKSYKEVADEYGISIAKLKAKMAIAKSEDIAKRTSYAVYLRDHKQYGPTKIGEIMGEGESEIRHLLKNYEKHKVSILDNVSTSLQDRIDEGIYLDIGKGTEHEMRITRNKLEAAVHILEEKGYVTMNVQVPNMGLRENQKTTIKVLCPPGTTYGDVVRNMTNIKEFDATFEEAGLKTGPPLHYPEELSSKRIAVCYKEDGGADRDGLVLLKKGAEGLDLGLSNYGQIRINVDGTHYIKGMAMYDYNDQIPKGKDILIYSNKKEGTPLMLDKEYVDANPNAKQVLKNMENINDPTNPFGATIKPGGQRGYLNLCKEEGEWEKQTNSLAAQFLSKQSPDLARKQLALSYSYKKEELDEIMSYTNPAVRKKLLDSFADQCDSDSVELHAAALPRQAWKVLLPMPELKDNEVYAPTFRDGEKVVLVRYPHEGTFQIPVLTVNNKNPLAKKALGNSPDAILVGPKAAEQLSGADYDGDTCLVIPTRNVKIRTHAPLAELVGYDAKALFPGYEGMRKMTQSDKELEMGKISNLLTDMQAKGCTDENELARAAMHSQCVIDAKKHNLDYKRSYEVNRIRELEEKWQHNEETGKSGGASTLISRSRSPIDVEYRKKKYKPNPETGEIEYYHVGDLIKDRKTGKTVTLEAPMRWVPKKRDADGKVIEWKQVPKTIKSKKMLEYKDAHDLSSGTIMEEIYADYANQLKALANQARKASVNTPIIKTNDSAKKEYKNEVISLNAKVMLAEKHAPRERQARIVANSIYEAQLASNPEWKSSKDKKKKLRGNALREARDRVGASSREKFDITPREWEAIQSGAVTNNKILKILNYADDAQIKQYASPRPTTVLSPSKIAMIKAMSNSHYTLADIADRLGVSTSTVSKALKG